MTKLLDPKSKTPSQSRGKRRVQLLLDAAADLILIHGPEGLRMDMVAKHAATSPGSLYQFFPNRAALLLALMERYGKSISTLAEEAVRKQLAQPPASIADAAREFATPFLDFYAKNRAYVIMAEASDRVFCGTSYFFAEDDDVAQAMRLVLQPFVSATQQDRLDIVCRMMIVLFDAVAAKSFDMSDAARTAWLAELDCCIQSYIATLQ
jgi:AcrR family transcriptional regulator